MPGRCGRWWQQLKVCSFGYRNRIREIIRAAFCANHIAESDAVWIEMNWSNKDPAQFWSLHQMILRMLTDSAHGALKLEELIQWRAQSMFSTSARQGVRFGGFVSVSDRWRWWKPPNLTRHKGWFISKSNLKYLKVGTPYLAQNLP